MTDEKSQLATGGGGGGRVREGGSCLNQGQWLPLLHQLKMTHRRRKEPMKLGYGEGEAETEAEATGRGADSWGFHILSS